MSRSWADRQKTFAQKVPGGYLVHGQKVWTSTAQVANKIMLLTRTTRYEDCARPTDGITIFCTDLDRSKIDVQRIPKMGRKAVDSNAVPVQRLREINSRMISEVPPYSRKTRASAYRRQISYSRMKPYPPKNCRHWSTSRPCISVTHSFADEAA